MPEDAEREPPSRVLDRLDRAVVRPGGLAQAVAQAAVALVMVALDRRVLADDLVQLRAREHVDVVVGEDTGRVLVALVADHLGQVLDEITPKRDVEDLAAAADRQHRHVARECAFEERQLGGVALRAASPFVSGCASAPYDAGSRSAPPEKMRPSRTSSVSSTPVGARRHEQRPPSGRLDGATYASGISAAGAPRRPSGPPPRTR